MSVGWGVLRNFREHAEEMGAKSPTEPLFFLMPPGSLLLVSDNHSIIHPGPDIELHYEVEFVVRIGPNGLPNECGVGLDLTNRSAQKVAKSQGLPWTDAKAFPNSGPFSSMVPYESSEFEFRLEVNGEICQVGNTSQMVHDVENLVQALHSRFSPNPGDLIFTGSPAGVGPLFPGDKLEASLWKENKKITHFIAKILSSGSN
ncbi:MAG: fumarylacetoacetate hydrolase family protein [Candidatus Thalassarchaeaceae archaeon]|nr:fumarylacetoacetate hydrolase family protein [Candidatus Thalassarchaeaceae archaeon]